jgi:hypothetical protein
LIPLINPYRFVVPMTPSGGWVELGRTTLGSVGTSINVTGLANKRYYMILASPRRSATGSAGYNFDSDTGANYAFRYSNQGASDATGVSDTRIFSNGNGSSTNTLFHVGYVANLASKEKLIIFHATEAAATGAGSAPERFECVGKHSQTSTALTDIGLNSTANYDIGSELVILGWDPEDTHTSNFWEELGSADWVSGSSLPTVSFTAKKYLWVQYFTSGGIGGDGANRVSIRVGNGSIDTSNNYAFRNSETGGADSTATSTDRWLTHTGNKKNYVNMFIVNNASNEKSVIYHTSEGNGVSASTAPTRIEGVGKWTNTSNQINRLSVFDYTGGNTFDAGTVKIWGSD